ncbi:MAG: hypothetical protein ABMA64_24240 [Myxococcota bacterium]
MSAPIEHPGPAPEGMVVRPQGEGFYARVWPRPTPRAGWLVPRVAAIALASGAAWAGSGPDPSLRWTVAGSIALFGALLVGYSIGAGFVPVEISVDDDQVDWGGERFGWAAIGDCAVAGDTLELRSREGRVLAAIRGLEAPTARWLSLAIRASVPGGPPP